MASVNSVSSSNLTSSLYNSSHIISGLASGLDTEGMIEGLVQSYQTKIQDLTNKATKLEWKQEAYRSIISKMYAFGNKYTSYSSASNLMSSAFFTNSVKVAAMGANADKVTASGRTDSEVKLNSVKQLATAARLTTQSNLKGSRDENGNFDFSVSAESAVKFGDEFDSGALNGSLTLAYGGKTVSVVFNPSTDIIEDKVYKTNYDGSYLLDKDGRRIVERDRTAEEKAADLQALIQKKLSDSSITLSSGESKKASDMIDVQLSGSTITFKDKTTGGNSVYISSASDSVKDTLGLNLTDADKNKPASFRINSSTKMVKTQELGEYVSGKSMNLSLDGKTKTINLPTIRKGKDGSYEIQGEDGKYTALTAQKYVDTVQSALDKAYGTGKLKVSNLSDDDNSLQLSIQAPDHSDLVINTDVGKALGIGNTAANYLRTSMTLGELMDEDAWSGLSAAKGTGEITAKNNQLYDAEGRRVNKAGNLIDDSGNELYEFKINDVVVGNYSKDTKLSTIMNDINGNSELNMKLTYSQTTRQFTFTSKDTGSENKIELGKGLAQAMFGGSTSTNGNFAADYNVGLEDGKPKQVTFSTPKQTITFEVTDTTTTTEVAERLNKRLGAAGYTASYNESTGQLIITDKTGKTVDLKMSSDGTELKPGFKSSYTPGQDAVFTVEVNGQELVMNRGSNSANIDGMTINFKDTFNENYKIGDKPETEAITFSTSTDSDKIVDAIKSMISDYNEMMSEIKTAYGTLPYQDSSGAFKSYEPLSDDDKASMSESAIQNYEAKAKQGLLFNDYNLSSLYQRLQNVFALTGQDGATLSQMGISRSYSSDGSSYIALDESKLREALDNDIDAVADLFTRSTDAGSSSNGIMQNMKTQVDRYAGTTGAVKGILVQQAGTPLSSLSLLDNAWQKQIDSLGDQITKWQDKLSTQVDKYTSMFAKLETLISQMNSQSSTLAGMMGG